jgi:hypothetical protein
MSDSFLSRPFHHSEWEYKIKFGTLVTCFYCDKSQPHYLSGTNQIMPTSTIANGVVMSHTMCVFDASDHISQK